MTPTMTPTITPIATTIRCRLARAFRLAVAAGAGLGLAGCYVLPIDPRTGQPYPPSGRDGHTQPLPAAPPMPLAVPVSVRLYPLNAQASGAGTLAAQVVDNQAGRGRFSVAYLGDLLQGESTRVDASYAAFGNVYDDVLGPTPRSFSGRRGIANAAGTRGVHAQCEYVLTSPGTGTGVCRFSDGAAYQMHFGG